MTRGFKLKVVTLVTLGRVPLVVAFFIGALLHSLQPSAAWFTFAFACVVLASLTDLLDGYLARRFKVETRFGAHADPLMDKIFYLVTLPLLVFITGKNDHHTHSAFLLIMTVLFLSRDQWVTFLRSIGSMYQVKGNANWSGKLRTCVNFPLICGLYYFEAAPPAIQFLPALLVYLFEAIAMALNLISLHIYTRLYWPYLRKSASLNPEP